MTDVITEFPAVLSGPGLNASVVDQLRAAADFLENTPGVKVSALAEAVVWYFTDSTAEVDEIAAALGKEARWDGHHYSVKERFGNEVAYSALHVCKGQCKPSPPCGENGATGTGRAA